MTWRDAARHLADQYGVTYAQLLSQQRDANVLEARFLLYWYMREHRALTFPQIAMLLGRDHSSIINGYRKAKDMIRANPSLLAVFQEAAA